MQILMPAIALVAVTFVVWLGMYFTRLRYMRINRIDPNDVATRERAAKLLEAVAGPSDNLRNLFELPVLFYLLIVLLFDTGHATANFVSAAWAFVALRTLHSAIHCTYNDVMHRFTVYAMSSLVLWGMWIAFALKLLG
jgi:hypothetical protein